MPQRFNHSRTAPLPLPNESGSLPIFHLVKARLGQSSSVTASVCERNTGKGKVELRKSAKRHRTPQPTASSRRASLAADSSELLHSGEKIEYHKRHWLFGLQRADTNVSLSMNVRDTEHGTVNMRLHPSKRINISVHLRRLVTLPAFRNSAFLTSQARNLSKLLPPCIKQRSRSRTGELRLRHELEHKWNEQYTRALYSLEAFQHIISIRIRNNPLRITPKLQAPLWAGGENAPCLIWEREPKSGPGELQLMRKPCKISYEFQRRRVGIYHFSKGGSISKISFDTQIIDVEQTMTHVLKGALVTTTSKLSSQYDSSGVTISATAPWGKIAAHGRPRSSFVVSSDAIFDYSKRCQLRAMIQVESLSRLALRLGVFY